MVFSSHLFLFYFLTVALLLYALMPRRMKNLLLTVVSYIFYGWANPLFMLLMFMSSTIDYVCGLLLAGQFGKAWREPIPLLQKDSRRTRTQKTALAISLCSNLALLGFFK
jgi:alginate O-acetyltransferase complex protein AlgI